MTDPNWTKLNIRDVCARIANLKNLGEWIDNMNYLHDHVENIGANNWKIIDKITNMYTLKFNKDTSRYYPSDHNTITVINL